MTLVGKLEHLASKALDFPGGGKWVPAPSSTAGDPHRGDEVRNVGCEVQLVLEITGAAHLPLELGGGRDFWDRDGMGWRRWSRARVCPHWLLRSWRCP